MSVPLTLTLYERFPDMFHDVMAMLPKGAEIQATL